MHTFQPFGPESRNDGSWYLIHPALVTPRAITTIGDATLRAGEEKASFAILSEEVQILRLQRLWLNVCNWAVSKGVDEVLADVISRNDVAKLSELGFSKRARGEIGGDSDVRASHIYNGANFSSVLPDLFSIAVIDLYGSANSVPLFATIDGSWDSLLVFSKEPPFELMSGIEVQ